MMSSFEELFRTRFGRSPTQNEMQSLVNQSVTSFNQSGGITAHTVNLGAQPRVMMESLKQQILREVPKTKPIGVVAVMGDSEAFQFAKELHAFLANNGYSLAESGISQAIFNEPVKGLGFNPEKSEFVVGANIS